MGRDAIKHPAIHRTHPTSDTQNYLVQNDCTIKVEKPHCSCTVSTFSDPVTWKKTDGSSLLYPENNTHHFYPQHSCHKQSHVSAEVRGGTGACGQVDDIFYKHCWYCHGLKQKPAANILCHWSPIFKLLSQCGGAVGISMTDI